jgi:pyridoxamine 5'-phosphate oxidase
MRSATLASLGADGSPQARIVILREAQSATKRLSFFTDARSPKVAEIERTPEVQWLLWHPTHQIQLRLTATAKRETDKAALDAAWARVSQSPAAGDYLSFQAPGEALERSEAPLQTDAPAFCIIRTQIHSMDALKLSREGHRRARFEYREGELLSAVELQP